MNYYLFAYSRYYPSGGWLDFRGCYETIEQAQHASTFIEVDRFEIVDVKTQRIILDGMCYYNETYDSSQVVWNGHTPHEWEYPNALE